VNQLMLRDSLQYTQKSKLKSQIVLLIASAGLPEFDYMDRIDFPKIVLINSIIISFQPI
jgi:hypothetical protein